MSVFDDFVEPLSEGQVVLAVCGDNILPGVIAGIHDPDQGDFEYYVYHGGLAFGSSGSFWPRECLIPVTHVPIPS